MADDDQKVVSDQAEEPQAAAPVAEEPSSEPAAPADSAAAPAGTDPQGRQLYNIKCSTCGKAATVPFQPKGDRPVYCRDCYMKSKGQSA
ncbi:hypothetical protein FJZ40_04000 [Candidatus Shapirobacteria bacterium]|nr:hypothetical protein [Candidatus Shapirobacteria bacterium]